MNPAKKAFTLIELLIVVAIIAILAAIAVPNFLESQTRTKVTRARNDIRAMTTAIEAYRVDHNKYPPSALSSLDFDGRTALHYITTPVAYIVGTSVNDIFAGKSPKTTDKMLPQYGYIARNDQSYPASGDVFSEPSTLQSSQWYMLLSHGPDLLLNGVETAIRDDNFPAFIDTMYDPTNGIISEGNIYRANGSFEGNGKRMGLHVNNYGSVK